MHLRDPRVVSSTSNPPPAAAEAIRVDRWLWSVRLFKTRTDATRACTGGHVTIDGRPAKAAMKLTVGTRVVVTGGERIRDLEVTRLIDKRVGAPVAATCFIDHSPPAPEREPGAIFAERDPGAGRPTKRDRRQLDRTFGRRD